MKMKKIKLGIIGMSEGNGHPYSWSAICNGFESNYMQKCPFPVIPEYLSKEKYPDNFIKDAEVTHIWTQKREYSEHIAKAAKISNIVDNAIDMIGEVDGVLLARDDAENHYEMCKPFVEAGIMIYIAFQELIPQSRKYGYNLVYIFSLILGICIIPISHIFL